MIATADLNKCVLLSPELDMYIPCVYRLSAGEFKLNTYHLQELLRLDHVHGFYGRTCKNIKINLQSSD